MTAGVLVAQPPDPINQVDAADPKLNGDGDSPPPGVRCFDLYFNSNNNSVINVDCPEETVFEITVLKNKCGCENFNIIINNNYIKTVDKAGLAKFSFTEQELLKWTLLNGDTGPAFLTIEIQCTTYSTNPFLPINFKERISFPIQIVKSGQEYTAEIKHSINQPLANYCPEEIVDGPIVCCNPSAKIEISNGTATILGSSTKSIINVQAQLELNAGPATILFPISTTNSWEDYEINETSEIDIESVTIDGSKSPKGCQQFGLQAYGDIYTYQKFVAYCGPDKPIGTPWKIKVPQKFKLTVCPVDADPGSSCPPIKKPVVENRRNIYNRLSCTGSIDLDLEEQDELIIAWTDENGKLIDSPNGDLSNVPLGQYTVTISNKCCDVYTETFYLCDDVNKSDYTQKPDGQWCRTVTCYGEGCNEEYTECVTPDRIDDEFDQNQKKCIKKYYHNNVLLGTTSVDATSETEWDDIFEECVTKYLCNGSEVFDEEYEPEESEWVYDEFYEECRRHVNCRGEEFENVEQVEAEIEWEWDDFFDECVSTSIDCNGEEATNEISVEPYEVEDWIWGADECYRHIFCIQGEDEITQTIPSDYVLTGQTCNGGLKAELYCDGEYKGIGCIPNIMLPDLSNRSKRMDVCKIKMEGDHIFVQFEQLVSTVMQLYISDAVGRTSITKIVEKGTKDIRINVADVPTGLYFINMKTGGHNIHTEKVFIQN